MAYTAFALRNNADAEQKAREEAFREDLAIRMTCPSCPRDREPNIVEEMSSGDLVCGNCGLVLGDRIIDTRSEWRTFASDEGGDDPSRVGGPSNSLVDGIEDFGTVISFKDNHSGIAKDLQRAAKTVSQRSGEKSLSEGFRNIQDMCEVISLNRAVSDMAKQLYKRVDEEKILRGKPHDAVVASCIFVACRQARVPRTFQEIVTLTHVNKKMLATCFKVLKLKFENTGIQSQSSATSSSTSSSSSTTNDLSPDKIAASAEDIVNRFASNLALPPNIASAACQVVRKVTEMGTLAGRSPITVATACIYFTAALFGQPKPAKEVAKVGGLAEGTVKFSYRLILPDAEKIINQDWIKSGKADLSRLP